MKIRLLSDLHAEGGIDKKLLKTRGEDVLVIAGDLHVGPDNTWSLLKQFADYTPEVVYVPGNHEYYRYHMDDFLKLEMWAEGTNVHVLRPDFVKIKDVTFIGATLWTNFQNDHIAKTTVPRMITDFRLIKGFDADRCVQLHTDEFKFIKGACDKIPGKKVVVTHFLPANECTAPEYKGEFLINKYFANDHAEFISDLKDVPYWFFGHTHTPTDIQIGDTRLIANPYGYGKNLNYNEVMVEV